MKRFTYFKQALGFLFIQGVILLPVTIAVPIHTSKFDSHDA